MEQRTKILSIAFDSTPKRVRIDLWFDASAPGADPFSLDIKRLIADVDEGESNRVFAQKLREIAGLLLEI